MGNEINYEARDALTSLSIALIDIKRRQDEADDQYKAARNRVFALIDGLAGPDSKLTVDVPETGRRIGRTMAYGSPGLDEAKLREVVGDEKFAKVTTKTVTYTLNFEALRDAIRDEEITRSEIEKAIIPGRVTQRLLHSKIGSKDDDEPRSKSAVEGLLEF